MSLKSCRECDHQISTKADSCPNCGASQKAKHYGCGTLILIFIVFSILASTYNYHRSNKESAQQRLADQLKAAEVNNQREELKRQQEALFTEKRGVIILQVSELINDGKIDEAKRLVGGFNLVGDPAIVNLRNKLKEISLLDRVASIPSFKSKENRDVYRQLVAVSPNNKVYKKKLDKYQAVLDEQAKAAAIKKAKKKAERDKLLAKYGPVPELNNWDGSYFAVTKYLKKVANDPGSIEMDGCTKVSFTDSGWLVGCDYRGKNAFGAVVRQSNWFTIIHNTVVAVHEPDKFKP